MKLYEVLLRKKPETDNNDRTPRPVKSHLVIETTAIKALAKVKKEYPDHYVTEPNMIFDFNPK